MPNGNCGQVRRLDLFTGMRCSLFLPFHSFGSRIFVVIAFFLRTQVSQVISSTNILTHPDYNSSTQNNDFALVRLSSPATATPVTMDMDGLSGTYTSSDKLWAIGFGNTVTSGQNLPSRLKHVEISYVPTNTCNSTNMYGGEITQNMMCAADPNEDSCQGDSGAWDHCCLYYFNHFKQSSPVCQLVVVSFQVVHCMIRRTVFLLALLLGDSDALIRIIP